MKLFRDTSIAIGIATGHAKMLTTLVISKYHCFTVSIHILKLALNILRDIKIGSAKKKKKRKDNIIPF